MRTRIQTTCRQYSLQFFKKTGFCSACWREIVGYQVILFKSWPWKCKQKRLMLCVLNTQVRFARLPERHAGYRYVDQPSANEAWQLVKRGQTPRLQIEIVKSKWKPSESPPFQRKEKHAGGRTERTTVWKQRTLHQQHVVHQTHHFFHVRLRYSTTPDAISISSVRPTTSGGTTSSRMPERHSEGRVHTQLRSKDLFLDISTDNSKIVHLFVFTGLDFHVLQSNSMQPPGAGQETPTKIKCKSHRTQPLLP